LLKAHLSDTRRMIRRAAYPPAYLVVAITFVALLWIGLRRREPQPKRWQEQPAG
jgi:hypothetical protein